MTSSSDEVKGDGLRLLTAQWVLERNLTWIAAAEVKVGVLVAICTAMLGALGVAFGASEASARTEWTYIGTVASATALAFSLGCAAMAVLPRVNGPDVSLVFFGRISAMKRDAYIQKIKSASDEQLLDDWAAQIHRNAEIASEKFSWVSASMRWAFASILPWVAAIAALMWK